MKVKLANYYLDKKIVALDLDSGDCEAIDATTGVNGTYDLLGDLFIAIFMHSGHFYLWWNNRAYRVENIRRVERLDVAKWQSSLKVWTEDSLLEVQYEPRIPIDGIFYTESKEDVDLGAWLARLLVSREDLERQRQVWGKEA